MKSEYDILLFSNLKGTTLSIKFPSGEENMFGGKMICPKMIIALMFLLKLKMVEMIKLKKHQKFICSPCGIQDNSTIMEDEHLQFTVYQISHEHDGEDFNQRISGGYKPLRRPWMVLLTLLTPPKLEPFRCGGNWQDRHFQKSSEKF